MQDLKLPSLSECHPVTPHHELPLIVHSQGGAPDSMRVKMIKPRRSRPRSLPCRLVGSGLAFQANHGNQAIGPLLVVRKRRPDLRHLLVKTVPLSAVVDHTRASFELFGSALRR